MQDIFHVQPVWDSEVNRWYCKSDIRGLAIETDTLEEFEELVVELAGDLIVANHLSDEDVVDCGAKGVFLS